ncbi:MAG: HAD-IIIC family phosphatase [Chloroflexi bacterium]|nr:HAD-IIIC family phosphatase [Chloroflexota bacterium]
MDTQRFHAALIGDFNLGNFANYLSNDDSTPQVEAAAPPYGQVAQILMNPDHDTWLARPDVAVIWTRPDGVIASFKRLLDFEQVSLDQILAEVEQFAALIAVTSTRVKAVFIPTWVVPTWVDGLGLLDMRDGIGVANTLMRMNLRLAEYLRDVPNVYLLNTQKWIERSRMPYQPKFWYMAKVAFGNDVFKEAVKTIKSALVGISGKRKKLIVLDLDNTLWGGVVGDIGWENLSLGGHDATGEAYVDFQRALKALTRRGIVLGVVSKNEENVAFDAIRQHPEMVLTLDDFAGWRINWQDKAQNVADLVTELNLGFDSVVFLDDNPAERARVRDMLPDVLVPELPEDPMLYVKTLLSLGVFDAPTLTAEDAERTKMYVTDRQRTALKTEIGSLDDWLQTLGVRVEVAPLNASTLPRTAQLFNKTNQLNLSTRRMGDADLMAWAHEPNHRLWTVSVTDKFGDLGLTGIISLEVEGDRGRIVDYVLSCRVMGRKVEETMLAVAVDYARSLGLREVVAVYRPTAKNKPTLDFFKRSGFAYVEDTQTFTWATNDPYPVPKGIELAVGETI